MQNTLIKHWDKLSLINFTEKQANTHQTVTTCSETEKQDNINNDCKLNMLGAEGRGKKQKEKEGRNKRYF